MAQRGHVITVWTPHVIPNSAYKEEPKKGISILRFPAFEVIPNYPVPKIWQRLFWQQWKIIHKLLLTHTSHPVVIVSRTRFFLTSLLALYLAKIYQHPWMHIEHGSDFVYLHNRLLRSIARTYDHTLGRLVLRYADTVVANSHASAAFALRISRRRPDAVIYRGADIAAIDAIAPVAKPDPLVILYIGRLIDSKGVHDLLAALAALKNDEWQTWIIGNGSQKNALRQQAVSLGIIERVSFLGEISWQNAIARVKSAAMLVNPSYNEGAPTTVLEAAMAGTPIVATNVGGTSELVADERQALLVSPGDISGISQAIRRLLQDSDLRNKLATAARRAVCRQLSWDETAIKYEKLLDEIK